jgi:hypothetical protein
VPGLNIVLDIFKHIAPDPILQVEISKVESRMRKQKRILCYNKECSKMYKIEKANGTSTFILYDKNMTELNRRTEVRNQSPKLLSVD